MQQTVLDEEVRQKLTSLISSSIKPDTEVLGSKLGTLLAPLIKPLSLRDFGGLKQFAETNLLGAVIWVGRDGRSPGDDRYRILKGSTATAVWQDVASLTGS